MDVGTATVTTDRQKEQCTKFWLSGRYCCPCSVINEQKTTKCILLQHHLSLQSLVSYVLMSDSQIILKTWLQPSLHFLCGLYKLHCKSLLPKNSVWTADGASGSHLCHWRCWAPSPGGCHLSLPAPERGAESRYTEKLCCTLDQLKRYLFPGRTAKFYLPSISSNIFCLFCCRNGGGRTCLTSRWADKKWLKSQITLQF